MRKITSMRVRRFSILNPRSYGFGILIVLLTIRQPEMKKSATGK